jgi:4-hydroxybenzoate polyprenyltransferase
LPEVAEIFMLHYVRLLRPRHMIKNAFCFAGVLFSGQFADWSRDLAALATFFAFCCVSSAVYILNDILDCQRDRQHPFKRYRPIARGAVSIPAASLLGILLAVIGVCVGLKLNLAVAGCLAAYLANNVLYSVKLKHYALLDVISIAMGFVFRMLAGVYAVDELPTTWITLCTFFLCIFLGFAKRRAELADMVPSNESAQRPVLVHYTVPLLDDLTTSAAIMTTLCYALFTTSHSKSPSLVITVPIVYFAVTHYKRLVMIHGRGQEPDRIVLKDATIQFSLGLWLLIYFLASYSKVELFR